MPEAEPSLVLASASARRSELLQSAGIAFEVIPANIDERLAPAEAPGAFARRIAREKAEAVRQHLAPHDTRPVLAADTIVVVDGETFGKPEDRADARRMIHLLADREHEVLTAFCLLDAKHCIEQTVRTRVRFRRIDAKELERYLDRASWQDKAGAYAIQAEAGAFVRAIEGSYSNVVGLPLCETLEALVSLRGAT